NPRRDPRRRTRHRPRPATAVRPATHQREGTTMTEDDTGSYIADSNRDGRRHLWWAPPDGFPRQPLPAFPNPAPPGADPSVDTARMILQHATGDDAIAERHYQAFARDLLDHAAHDPGL